VTATQAVLALPGVAMIAAGLLVVVVAAARPPRGRQ
jgi:hypothetical protein